MFIPNRQAKADGKEYRSDDLFHNILCRSPLGNGHVKMKTRRIY